MQYDNATSPKDNNFAQYVRDSAQLSLAAIGGDNNTRLATKTDIAFMNALNRYLKQEGQPPVHLEIGDDISNGFEPSLREALRYKTITSKNHVFTNALQAKGRSSSRERQQHLADLYEALHLYRSQIDSTFKQDATGLKTWQSATTSQAGEGNLLQTSKINFESHTLIIVPGLSTTHERDDNVKSYFRQAELMLGTQQGRISTKAGAPRLYSLSYPYHGNIAQMADIFASNANPNKHVAPMVQQWVDNTLLPSLGIRADAPANGEELERSLSKLRFYSVSYGSIIVQQIRTAMTLRLKEYGYSQSQLCKALTNVFALNNNPLSMLSSEAPEDGAFTTLHSVSSNDTVSNSFADYEVDEGKKIKQVNSHAWLYVTDAPQAGINIDVLESGKAADWIVPRGELTQLGHHSELTAHHSMIPQKHGKISYHSASPIQNVLRWAMSGKQLPADLTQAFKSCYLVEVDKQKRDRHAKRTDSALNTRFYGRV